MLGHIEYISVIQPKREVDAEETNPNKWRFMNRPNSMLQENGSIIHGPLFGKVEKG